MNIVDRLFILRDEEYLDFNSRLVPNVDKSKFIGVRVPNIRAIAREISGTPEALEFLNTLPHTYVEEYMLHGFLIEKIRDFDRTISELDRFLPFVDNWAVTDTTSPKNFKKHKKELIPHAKRWLSSNETYVVRYGVLTFMRQFLDADYSPEYLSLVANIKSEEYYINMAVAWYFATALAKHYEDALVYLRSRSLTPFVHNMTIKKACESFRIGEERKAFLKTLKI